MKEQIYTIPVMDAFREESECSLCILEKKLEDQYIEYFLGPSLMESDCRIETNKKGFCKTHFELLYNKQENRLGLGLIIDTHLHEQNKVLRKKVGKKVGSHHMKSSASLFRGVFDKSAPKKTPTEALVDELVEFLTSQDKSCVICDKMKFTMDRYLDVIFYLWIKEKEFQTLFEKKKGFCQRHFSELLKGSRKYLKPKYLSSFIDKLLRQQLDNMERIQKEVNWFTEKFDYRNEDKPWGDSKDAVPRSIQKIVGHSNLK